MGNKIEIVNMNIGKNGLSDNVLDEITTLFKKYKTIKLKFLPSSPERTDIASALKTIVSKTNSKLEKKIGFSAIISKNS